MRVDPDHEAIGDLNQYATRVAEWKAVARYPDLVSDVYVIPAGGSARHHALRLNSSSHEFEPVEWPAHFLAWAEALDEPVSAPVAAQEQSSFMGAAVRGWRFESEPPALLHRAGKAWILVGLNADVIRNRILPDLAHRYFQGTDGLDYLVAVVAGGSPREVLYTSDSDFGREEVTDADGTLNVFGRPLSAAQPSPLNVFHKNSENRAPSALATLPWFPLLRDTSAETRLAPRRPASARRTAGLVRGRYAAAPSGGELRGVVTARCQHGDARGCQQSCPAPGAAATRLRHGRLS